jgi:hypothetical protein
MAGGCLTKAPATRLTDLKTSAWFFLLNSIQIDIQLGEKFFGYL